jgi:hypothetical protein
MQASVRRLMVCLGVLCFAMSSGCETTERAEQPQWVPVQITDLSSVAGKWDGVMRRMPPDRRANDWVTVTIASDGRYQFTSLRTIGVFSGHGEFVVNEGKLKASSERGTIEAALYEAGGQRMLKAKGRTADGTDYTADVRPAK